MVCSTWAKTLQNHRISPPHLFLGYVRRMTHRIPGIQFGYMHPVGFEISIRNSDMMDSPSGIELRKHPKNALDWREALSLKNAIEDHITKDTQRDT
uniref:Uncharacterized protein n=1 Tax=Lactuca sativa TaxID=4236 RepID=A0A9R1W2T4_LACSA|nr:hypothetical protein LSAT_V11C300143690 [Lactuca sativa]